MKRVKLYDLIKELLITYPELRDSDKKLMWAVWTRQGYATVVLSKLSFYDEQCPTPETITRCRRKIQERFVELRASEKIAEARAAKESKKGNFVYQEKIKIKDENL